MRDQMTSAAQTMIQDDPAEEARLMAEFERRMRLSDERATAAAAAGRDALRRLLVLAEARDSGQIECIAKFLGASWNSRRHFDLLDLRVLDVAISDDMLTTLDALRWGVGLDELVPGAEARIEKTLDAWGMLGAGQTDQAVV